MKDWEVLWRSAVRPLRSGYGRLQVPTHQTQPTVHTASTCTDAIMIWIDIVGEAPATMIALTVMTTDPRHKAMITVVILRGTGRTCLRSCTLQ